MIILGRGEQLPASRHGRAFDMDAKQLGGLIGMTRNSGIADWAMAVDQFLPERRAAQARTASSVPIAERPYRYGAASRARGIATEAPDGAIQIVAL